MLLPPPPAGQQRGQAVVEYVAWSALLALLLAGIGAALVSAGVPGSVVAAVSRALGGDDADTPSGVASATPATRALVVAAMHGSPDGNAATVGDAERLLAVEIGPEAARAEVARLALADFVAVHGDRLTGVKEVVAYGASADLDPRFSGVGTPSTPRWHGIEQRRPGAAARAHVVTAAAARRLRDVLHGRNTADLHRDELMKLAAEAGLTALVPWLAVPFFAAEVLRAVRSEKRLAAFPAALRGDDVLLCYPVRRLNTFSSESHRRRWGAAPTSLDMGRRHDMTHLVTVRSGVVIAEALSDASTCT